MKYAINLIRDTNDTYYIECPDLPKANSFGDTKEEAIENTLDAIETAFIIYMDQKVPIPTPRAEGEHYVQIPVRVQAKVALYNEMLNQKVKKAEIARRLGWNQVQADRLLDFHHSTKLESLESAFAVLGRQLDVCLV